MSEPRQSLWDDRPEFAVQHPDDETLTVADALNRLHRDNHQRIAALVEWLAEELARKNAAIYEARFALRESVGVPLSVSNSEARKALDNA